MPRRLASAVVAAVLMLTSSATAEGLDPFATWEADPLHVFDATDVDLEAFEWRARPVVVFANSPFDPAFAEQMEFLLEDGGELVARDVVIVVDTDPDGGSEIRRRLRPRGFMLALVGKDGEIELRKPQPWTVRELSRTIDKMPLRRQELREGS